jgi:CRP-like cAMP-binding protein
MPKPSNTSSHVHPQMDPSTDHLEQLLGAIAPCSADATVRLLIGSARIRAFAAGEVVIAQGQPATLGLVIDGVVAARRTNVDGHASVAKISRRGEILSVMVVGPRQTLFDYVGLVPGVVAQWPGAEVRSLASADPGFGLDLLGLALGGFGQLVGRLDTQHYQDARKRVARVLHEHRDLCFGDRPPVARAAVSLLTGTSQEMSRRVLARLEGEGIIRRLRRGGLELRDATRLQALAGFRSTEADG